MSWNQDLKNKAEKLLNSKDVEYHNWDSEEIKKIIHNFKVHQIELEMQNEELVKAQEALLLSRDSFSNLYHYAPVGYVAVNRHGMILHANKQFVDKMGVPEKDLLDKPFSKFVAPEYTDTFLIRFSAFFKKPENKTIELKLLPLKKPSFYARIQAAHLPSAIKLFNLDFEEKIVLITIYDITYEKEQETALLKSEEKYRNLFENAPIGIITVNTDGHIMEVNQKLVDILGSPSQEATLRINMFTFPPLVEAGISQKFQLCIEEKKPLSYETQYVSKWGSNIFVRFNLVPIFEKEKIIGVQSTIEDISEKKKIEMQREALLDEKNILLKEIHHRVKNNFNLISSLINLQARTVTDQSILDFYTIIHNRIRTMAIIHENLYRYDNLSEIKMDEFFNQLVTGLIGSYDLYDKNILVVNKIKDVFLDIHLAIPCGLIVNELVTNSLKYAFPAEFKKRPEITVVMRSTSECEYFLSVEDNGIGLPEHINLNDIDSFGLKITYLLAEKQLEGKLRISHKDPTGFYLNFEK